MMVPRKIRETRSACGWISETSNEVKVAASDAGKSLRREALGAIYDRIDRYRPCGLSAHGRKGQFNDGNDAWRHGMLLILPPYFRTRAIRNVASARSEQGAGGQRDAA